MPGLCATIKGIFKRSLVNGKTEMNIKIVYYDMIMSDEAIDASVAIVERNLELPILGEKRVLLNRKAMQLYSIEFLFFCLTVKGGSSKRSTQKKTSRGYVIIRN